MKFNLLEYGYVSVSGTVEFTVENVENLLNNSCTVTISGAGNDSVYIDCDLVDRIGIYEIRYHFDSLTASGTIASGISFSYKNDLIDSYTNLTTNIGDGYYYTTVPDLSAPRYIRLNHTVSGTSVSGTIKGFEVLNDDSVVDFGADGNLTSSTTLTSLGYLNYNDYIKEIEIYNSGSSIATAHVFIDPQHNDSDELLSISASESGPWVFARNINHIIVNGNNWDCGQYYDTNTSGIADGKLRLDSNKIVGTYITPIFKNDSVKFAYIDMLNTSVSGAIVATDSDDYTSTIQIRSSSYKPMDYNIYRKFISVKVSLMEEGYYYKDYLLGTDTEVYNSYTETGDYIYTHSLHSTGYKTFTNVCHISSTNSRCVYFHAWSYSSYGDIFIFLLDNNGSMMSMTSLRDGSCSGSILVYFIELGYDDDIWIYLYSSNSLTLGSGGYYLVHFNSNMNILYSEYGSSDFIIGLDVVKDNSGALWYSRTTGTQAILKISSTGEILLTYDSVTGVGRLCSTYDGGCWFIDENNLYKLNSNGVLIDSIINLDINNKLTWVMRDENDFNFLWIVDGAYIRLISLDGRVYRSVYLENFTITRLYSTEEYLAVFCTEVSSGDYYTKIIGRSSSGIDKTIANDGSSYDMTVEPGLKVVSYDNLSLGNIIPLSDDLVWNSSLEWNKAVTDNAILPREEYNQLKLTLRRPSTDIDSPTVENIYYQDNVEIADIYPGQSKTLYLKISLPDGITIGGDYSSMLRVWWELPVT